MSTDQAITICLAHEGQPPPPAGGTPFVCLSADRQRRGQGKAKLFEFEKRMVINMNIEYSIVFTTCADKESAKAIAMLLVEKRLAACVQLFPIESIYVWQGKICDDSETALLIKSKTALFEEISAAIKGNHSYEVPEIIQIPITDGHHEYLKWIDGNTGQFTDN